MEEPGLIQDLVSSGNRAAIGAQAGDGATGCGWRLPRCMSGRPELKLNSGLVWLLVKLEVVRERLLRRCEFQLLEELVTRVLGKPDKFDGQDPCWNRRRSRTSARCW